MSLAVAGAAAVQKPTRVRYIVLAFAATLSMITYLDRTCLASAQGMMAADLGVVKLGWSFAAFALAYSLFEIPTGWLGDVFGPRRTLIRIVVWWSFFTAITGLIGLHVGGYTLGTIWVLVIVQFLFGMGEAGCYPNLTRALHNWFPFRERGLAQGTMWMSGRLMGGLTPMIWALLVTGISYSTTQLEDGTVQVTSWVVPPLVHWRAAFAIFAGIGVVWCVLFALWFRDRPEKKASVNAAELALIRSSAVESQASHAHVPWLKIIRSGNLWTLCLMYFCQTYGWYFYITYLPAFLEEQYGVHPSDPVGAIYKGGPLWMGAIGCLLGGFLTDWFIRRTGNRKLGRRIFGIIGHCGCVLCFLTCGFAPTAFWFFLVISLAGFSSDITMASAWSICQDIGRRHAAIVAGCMNMIGNLAGTVTALVTGVILLKTLRLYAAGLEYVRLYAERLGLAVGQLTEQQLKEALLPQDLAAGLMPGYKIAFFIFAAVHVIGVICWCRVDSTKPVAPEDG